MSLSKDYEALELERLPFILDILLHEHPDPERFRNCPSGIYVRPLEDGRIEAYAVDTDEQPVIIGQFPAGMLLRQDVTHPISKN